MYSERNHHATYVRHASVSVTCFEGRITIANAVNSFEVDVYSAYASMVKMTFFSVQPLSHLAVVL